MMNITTTAKQQDDRIKVSYNGTAKSGTYVSGHYFLDLEEYEDIKYSDLRKMAYQKIVEDFAEEAD